MKKLVWTAVLLGILIAAGCYEWRYSADMQEHIDTVNADLESVRLEALTSTGLLGSIQTMTDETKVATEIMETREHVHTLKDEMLARKIKEATEQGVTVGGAIQNVIAKWPESI